VSWLNRLIHEIRKIIEDSFTNGRTILTWYDDGGTLSDIIHEAVPKDVSIIRFDGSYLKIRATIDGEDKNLERKWFIYVPEAPQDPSWIRDYETIVGSRVEYTIERILSERFGLQSDMEVKQLLSGYGGRSLASHWNEILETTQLPISKDQIIKALLAIAFELGSNFTIGHAILQYVSFPKRYGERLEKLKLHESFAKIIRDELELKNLSVETPVSPEKLVAAILFSELVTKSGGLGAREFSHLLPDERKRNQWVKIVGEWISDIRLRESFIEWSKKLSKQYNLKEKLAGFGIINIQSFADVDEVLLDEVCSRIVARGKDGLLVESENIKTIAETRSKMIWATSTAKYWEIIKFAIYLYMECGKALNVFQKMKGEDIEYYIDCYTANDGWWKLDNLYLKLVSEETPSDERISNLIIEPAVERYSEWLNKLAFKFSEAALKLSTWPPPKARKQSDFWKIVLQKSSEAKTAVLLIDALRYDLCMELYSKLTALGSRVYVEQVVASIPSITEIGMACLLPRNGKALKLSIEKDKIHVYLDEEFDVSTKFGRNKWLESRLGSDVIIFDLDEINRRKIDDLKRLTEKPRYIIVGDREIDRAGGFTPDISLAYFKMAVEKLKNVILKLHEAGIKDVIVGTDHGFLFLPKICKPTIIESIPSMKDLVRSRRYILGKPPKSEAFVTFQISSTEFSGDGYIALPLGASMLPMPGEIPIFIHGGLSPQEVCIANLISTLEKVRRVEISISVPEPVTSMKFFVDIIPVKPSPEQRARVIKIKILSDSEKIGESDVMPVHLEPCRTWVKLEKIVPTVEIQVLDTETEEVLYAKPVKIQLAGYDELL